MDGHAFGTSIAVNLTICILVLVVFDALRRVRLTQRFLAPKRYLKARKYKRPKALPGYFMGWLPTSYCSTQTDIIATAGLSSGAKLVPGVELFLFVTLWVTVVVLPTNLSGHQVDHLIGLNAVDASNFTYWVSPPPPPSQHGSPPAPASPKPIQAPNFYEDLPPAPPGLEWWKYRPEVPPLPRPEQFFNSSEYQRLGWRYDPNFQTTDYRFSNLDLTTMSNISAGDWRIWIHIASLWIISCYTWRLIWRYNVEAVALRMAFLDSARAGPAARTCVVTDVPGIEYGTLPHRIQHTLLRLLPVSIQRRLLGAARFVFSSAGTGMQVAVDTATQTILADASVHARPIGGVPSPALPPANPTESIDDSRPSADKHTKEGSRRSQTTREQGRRRRNMEDQPPPARELAMEVDAWTRAERLLHSGLNVKQMIEREFGEVFPGDVAMVRVVYDTHEVDAMAQEYYQVAEKLAELLDGLHAQFQRGKRASPPKTCNNIPESTLLWFGTKGVASVVHVGPPRVEVYACYTTVVGARYGSWGVQRYGLKPQKVDAITFYAERLRMLQSLMREARQRSLPPNENVIPTAFITFWTRKSQTVASTSMFHHDQTAWLTDAAPGPREVIWQNLGWRLWERSLRTVLTWVVFFLVVSFYIPVVSAIQALLQVEKLRGMVGIRWLARIPAIDSFIAGLLPSLVLRIFLALLPELLAYMGRMQGLISLSQVQFSVVRRYFAFQVLTVFFASFVAGSLWSQVRQLLGAPRTVLVWLGSAAPQTSTFFMSYLLFLGLTTRPIRFLRITELLQCWMKSLTASTKRARARLWKQQHIDYGYEVPDHSMAVLLGLTFCIIAPLIAPIALLYFLVSAVLGKYQMQYVYAEEFQSGGKVWREVANQAYFALLTAQLVMLGLLALKKAAVAVILLFPLPALTIALWTASHQLFDRPQHVLSLRTASDLDDADKEHGAATAVVQEIEEQGLYQPPVFAIDDDDAAALLADAERVQQSLEGEHLQMEDLEAGAALQGELSEYDESDGSDEFHDAMSTRQSEDLSGEVHSSRRISSNTDLRRPLLGNQKLVHLH